MGWNFGCPITEIISLINEKIEFGNVLDNVRVLSPCRFPVLKAKKTIEVDKLKVAQCCRRVIEHDWRIQVFVDDIAAELWLKPRHLLEYSRIILEYETSVEGGNVVLIAKGLREEPSHWLAHLRGFGWIARRNRVYRKTHEKLGLEDIVPEKKVPTAGNEGIREGQVPDHQTASHTGGYESSSLITNDLEDAADAPLTVPQTEDPAHFPVSTVPRNENADNIPISVPQIEDPADFPVATVPRNENAANVPIDVPQIDNSADIILPVPETENDFLSDQVVIIGHDAQPIDNAISDFSLEYYQPSVVGGQMVANMSSNHDIQQEIRKWRHAIVGYLVADDPQDHNVERYVEQQWSCFGPFKTYVLKPGFFLFKFTNEDDRFQLLQQRQQLINNKPFILKKWTPGISWNSSAEFLATVPVWVKFPDLKPQFWCPSSLSRISSIIGKPLFYDEPTAMMESLDYARVCIEITVGDKLPDTISISEDDNSSSYDQAVVYEWKPQPCGYCCSLLHDSSSCSLACEDDSSVKKLSGKAEISPGDESCKNSCNNDKVIDHEKPDFATCGEEGHDDNSIETTIDNNSFDEVENEVYYSPLACFPTMEKSSSMSFPYIYSKLIDIIWG